PAGKRDEADRRRRRRDRRRHARQRGAAGAGRLGVRLQGDATEAATRDGAVALVAVPHGSEALQALADSVFDCMVIDLKLPDMTGQELLRRMASGESRSFPPVIVYTGRNLTRDEEAELMRY